MTAPTFAIGDTVRVRNRAGTFTIVDLLLVRGEAVVSGTIRRPGHHRGAVRITTAVSTADLLPVPQEGDAG